VYVAGQKVYRATTDIYTLSPDGHVRRVADFASFATRFKSPTTQVLFQTVGMASPLPSDFTAPLPWQRTSYTSDVLHGFPGRQREADRLTQQFVHHLAGAVTTPQDNTRRLLGRRPAVARFATTSGLVSVWVDQANHEILAGTLEDRSYTDIGALVARHDSLLAGVVPGYRRPLGRLDRALTRPRHLRLTPGSRRSQDLGGKVLDYPSAKHAQIKFVSQLAAVGIASFAAAHNVGKLDTVVPATTSGAWALTKTLLAQRTADKNAVHFNFTHLPELHDVDLHNRSFDYITKLWDETPGVPPGFSPLLSGTSHTPELERRLTDAFEACRRSIEIRVASTRGTDGQKLTAQERHRLAASLEQKVSRIIAGIPRALESTKPLEHRSALLQYTGGAATLVASLDDQAGS
jgi:hypothetical protein